MSAPRVRLVRAISFSAGHRHEIPGESDDSNRAAYGPRLFAPDGFGFNWRLEAHFEGPVDPDTGMIENLTVIDLWLRDLVSRLDHRFLNTDVPEFVGRPVTTETIAAHCFEALRARMTDTSVRLVKLRLHEGQAADGWADIFASDLTSAERDF